MEAPLPVPPAPVATPVWLGLMLVLGVLFGLLVIGGVILAVVLTARSPKKPRRRARATPQPHPAFKWPDDRESLIRQRILAVLLSLLIAGGLVAMFCEVVPKAGFGLTAVALYGIVLAGILSVIVGLLRWGFRRPNAVRAMPAPSPPRPPAGPGYLLLAAGWSLGGLLVAFCLVGLLIANLSWRNSRTQINSWEESLIATVVFVFIPLALLTATRFTWINRKRLAESITYAHETSREKAPIILATPVPAAPVPVAASPAPAAPPPVPRKLGWMIGMPIAVFVVLGVMLTSNNGGRIGVQRVDIILVGGLVAFGAAMLVRVFRQGAPADAPATPVPLVTVPAAEVPVAAPPPLPRTCPKCGRPIAAGAPEGLCPRCLIGNLLPEEPRHSPTTAYGPFVPPEVEEVAPFFPQLEIIKLIGQGGMGAVYLARQKQLDRLVALKLIHVREDDPTFAERFSREAKAMGKLSHPNIVAIHDHGTADGLPYLVMEYVDGVTLRDAIRAKTLSPAEALKIIPQVCDALEYAHSQGVVHRDVKPENILIAGLRSEDRGSRKDGLDPHSSLLTPVVKIADFGLAKLVDPDGLSLTHTRQAMGTPHYMAPEQWERPTEVDHRADIYALGVLLYELLTGELPLGRFDPPSVKARVDARIDELVLRALSKEPDRRYQHASDMKLALQGIERSPKASGCSSGYYEYKSKTTLLGWPLVHVVRGVDPAFGQHRIAKGWIAIGDGTAIGGLAIAGGWAVGGLAVAGGGAVGVLALAGGGALGIISLAGGWAVGVGVAAAGGGAAAPGLAAAGGVAAGKFAIAGGAAWGEHVISSQSHDPAFGEQLLETLQRLWEGIVSLIRG